MKTICALLLTAALGAVGCTSTKSFTGDKYAADGPLADMPAGKSAAKPTGDQAPPEPATFGPAVSRVDPDAIDEANAHDYARRLQSDIKTDRSAMTKAGR
jgi:hypothetical protein